MNFIDKSSAYLARSIRTHHPEAAPESVLMYALSLIINSATAIVVSLLVALPTGHFVPCLLGIGLFIAIRNLTGGMHTSSSLSCCLLSIAIFTTISWMTFPYEWLGIALDGISLLIFICTVPDSIQEISSLEPKYYPALKGLSVLLVLLNIIVFHSTIATAAFLIQALTTTRLAYMIRDFFEQRFRKEVTNSHEI